MKRNALSLAHSLVMVFPLLGILLGLNIGVIFPIWIAATTLLVMLTLIVWYKEGRSFKPFVPLFLAIIGALAIAGVWVYVTR
jgi:multidrug transporter EmrE-like cation transporter